MSYLIQYVRNGEVIATDESFEKPSEDFLREECEKLGADFADISRNEEPILL